MENSVDKILIDMMKREKEATKKIFIILYLLIALLFVSFLINIFTVRELLQYQTTTMTETSETNEYTIDGENNQLNQYNDNAIHNETPNAETEVITTEVETWDNYYGD